MKKEVPGDIEPVQSAKMITIFGTVKSVWLPELNLCCRDDLRGRLKVCADNTLDAVAGKVIGL